MFIRLSIFSASSIVPSHLFGLSLIWTSLTSNLCERHFFVNPLQH